MQQWQTELDLYFQMVYNGMLNPLITCVLAHFAPPEHTAQVVPAAVEEELPSELPTDPSVQRESSKDTPSTPPLNPLHTTEADNALLDQVRQLSTCCC